MNERIRWARLPAGVVALALAAGACSDSTAPDTFDEALNYDVAVVAADATIEDFTLMTSAFGFGSLAGSPSMASQGPGASPGQPGGHKGIGGAFSGTRERTFFDAAGNEQEAYDSLTTASVHVVLELSGEVTRETWSASIDRTRDMTITGLEGVETTRTFNGDGTEDVARSRVLDDGTARTIDLTGSFQYHDVVVPVPGSETRWPLSGSITRQVTVTVVNGPNGDQTVTRDVTITFDGDETATVNVNGEVHEVDLSARSGRFPLRHRRGGNGGG